MIRIAMDCLGGDRSPEANLEGSVRALAEFSDLKIVFYGDEAVIKAFLKKEGADLSRTEIVHAPDAVLGSDKPTDAIRLKKDSSMVRAFRDLRDDASLDALVSSGATGVLVAASILLVGRLRGVRRPAFCPILPTFAGGVVGVCDSGANAEATPEMLLQQAVMGSAYMRLGFGVEQPRVALLNMGTEPGKGDTLRKDAYRLLEQAPGIRFVGNMESRDLLAGNYDLVVADGFSGNVLIKSTEGTAMELLLRLKKDIYASFRNKLGGLLLKPAIMEEREYMNYQNYPGAVLLGCRKVVMKGHGSSRASSIFKCVEQARRVVLSGMNDRIAEGLAALPKEDSPKEV